MPGSGYNVATQARHQAQQNNNIMSNAIGGWLTGGHRSIRQEGVAYNTFEVDGIQIRCCGRQGAFKVEYCSDGGWTEITQIFQMLGNVTVLMVHSLNLYITLVDVGDGWEVFGQKDEPYFPTTIEA